MSGVSTPFSDKVMASFEMSLRDAFRGVASFVEATEDALEPAASLVPHPLRSRVKDTLRKIEGHSKRLAVAPISTDDISKAAAFIAGVDDNSVPPEDFSAIFGFAWDHLAQVNVQRRGIVSEMLLTRGLSGFRFSDGLTPYERAAELCLHLRASRAIGMVPGLIHDFDDQDRISKDAAMSAVFVWLLCERAADIAGEERLLDLAEALVQAMLDQSDSTFEARDQLAPMLEIASRHI